MLAMLKAPALGAYMLAGFGSCTAPPPQLYFDYRVAKTEFNHKLSWEELERLGRKTFRKPVMGRLSGLTRTNFTNKFAVHGKEIAMRNDWHCYTPVKVVLTIELSPTVYIASAYRKGRCRYNETRKHEMRHVETATKTLEEFAPVILSSLRKGMKEYRPEGPGTLAQARRDRDLMTETVKKAYEGAVGEMTRELEKRQARIDADEEYKRVGAACAGEGD